MRPTTPQKLAGCRIEPPVSEPSAATHSPAATAAALPVANVQLGEIALVDSGDGKALAFLRSDAKLPARAAIQQAFGAPKDLVPLDFPADAVVAQYRGPDLTLLEPGDTIVGEEASYASAITRVVRSGAKWIGAPLDQGGIRMDALSISSPT